VEGGDEVGDPSILVRRPDDDYGTHTIRSPRANAYAERWVRTVRTECLDWLLVLGQRHLGRVIRRYVWHYNQQRPHRGIDLSVPVSESRVVVAPPSLHVQRHDVLGGLIHEYHQAAA
jgi:putative transposase